jgi:hypothetical protein
VQLENGDLVQDAQVMVAGLETASDANGNFSFQAVPTGSYEVQAEKVVNGQRLVAREPHEVTTGSDPAVTLVLKPEAAIPPPTIEAFERSVRFVGTLKIFDDDPNNRACAVPAPPVAPAPRSRSANRPSSPAPHTLTARTWRSGATSRTSIPTGSALPSAREPEVSTGRPPRYSRGDRRHPAEPPTHGSRARITALR